MAKQGRPTEYKEEYIEKAQEYLAECTDQVTEFHKTRGEKSDTYERLVHPDLPTHEGFARYIGVATKSLYNWAEEHPLFLQALDDIKDTQKQMLIKGGLSGDYTPMIAKLILSANHDMVERKDHTTGGRRLMISFDDSFTPETEEDS